MIDLESDELRMVKDILGRHLASDVQVKVFGSRLKKDHKKYADLDLLIIGAEKIPRETLFALQDAFEEADLSFRVDIVDWYRTSPEFRVVLEKQAEVLV